MPHVFSSTEAGGSPHASGKDRTSVTALGEANRGLVFVEAQSRLQEVFPEAFRSAEKETERPIDDAGNKLSYRVNPSWLLSQYLVYTHSLLSNQGRNDAYVSNVKDYLAYRERLANKYEREEKDANMAELEEVYSNQKYDVHQSTTAGGAGGSGLNDWLSLTPIELSTAISGGVNPELFSALIAALALAEVRFESLIATSGLSEGTGAGYSEEAAGGGGASVAGGGVSPPVEFKSLVEQTAAIWRLSLQANEWVWFAVLAQLDSYSTLDLEHLMRRSCFYRLLHQPLLDNNFDDGSQQNSGGDGRSSSSSSSFPGDEDFEGRQGSAGVATGATGATGAAAAAAALYRVGGGEKTRSHSSWVHPGHGRLALSTAFPPAALQSSAAVGGGTAGALTEIIVDTFVKESLVRIAKSEKYAKLDAMTIKRNTQKLVELMLTLE